MPDINAARDWSNVDTGATADYVDYLETMTAEDAIRA